MVTPENYLETTSDPRDDPRWSELYESGVFDASTADAIVSGVRDRVVSPADIARALTFYGVPNVRSRPEFDESDIVKISDRTGYHTKIIRRTLADNPHAFDEPPQASRL